MADGAEHAKVVEAAGVIGLATLLSRILGFARDMVLARLFGAAPAADAFFIAYRIPNLLRELFAEGSMSAAFSPVLFNIAIIAAAFLLAPLFAEPILAVAVGVVIGGLAQFLSQMPALRQAGLLFGWRFDFAHEGVRRIGWLMAPALIGLSV